MKMITLLILALALQVSSTELPLKIIYASNDCPNETALTKEITPQELTAIIAHHNTLNFPKIAIPEVDFNQSMLINIAIGKQSADAIQIQPTAATLVANLSVNVITLPFKITTPNEFAMQSQIINSPCVVVKLKRTDYHQIKLSH